MPSDPGYGPESYGPPWHEPVPYEDDHRPGSVRGPIRRRRPPDQRVSPLARPEPEAVPEEDTASRLLYAPPGQPHQAPRHRARIAGAVLGTVALLAGVITAWAVFGQDRAGPRLAGRQTTATHRASPGARATPSPATAGPGPRRWRRSWWPWPPG